MIDWTAFILAVLGLLATPGPTNMLMAASGAQRGLRKSLHLLAGELGGYAIAITVWIEIVGVVAAKEPIVGIVAKLVAVAFLYWSAWKLWRDGGQTDLGLRGITLSRVFVTTLLNPKALIFAFAIFPSVGFVWRLPYDVVCAVRGVTTAAGWMVLGALAQRGSAGLLTSALVERITALALAVFATVLAASALS